MKFVPELPFAGGRLRPLAATDVDVLFELYQHPELPGQTVPTAKDAMVRIIDYSIKAAATQRGILWLVEIDQQVVGILSVFDWHPSLLRLMLRVDALPALSMAQRQAALAAAIDYLGSKYHVNNFAYQWVAGQNPELKAMLQALGFTRCASLREAWRVGDQGFADIEQYHLLTHRAQPQAGRLGEAEDTAATLQSSSN